MPFAKKKNNRTTSRKEKARTRTRIRVKTKAKATRRPVKMVKAKRKASSAAARAARRATQNRAKAAKAKIMIDEAAAEEMRKISALLDNKPFLNHIGSTVGSGAIDILTSLSKSHKTDEDLAAQLNVKVNDIRRMLNMMNGYSIVKYDVNKDSKGWLIFTWKIDSERLNEYITNMSKADSSAVPSFPTNCNDFFVCRKCYAENKLVLPFDSAFEVGFRCGCGQLFANMTKEEATGLFKEAVAVSQPKARAY